MPASTRSRAAATAQISARETRMPPRSSTPRRHSHPPSSRSSFPLPRQILTVTAAGKGFGTSDKSAKGGEPAASKARRALDRATSPSVPIDPAEASRGRVDVATVKSWKGLEDDKGGRDALGELEVRSFASSSSASPSSPLGSQPLYEALARRLSVLQASGALAEDEEEKDVGGKGKKKKRNKKKLPRFEDWKWREIRYVQYLVDCLEVHSALEEAVGEALRGAEEATARSGGGEGEEAPSPSSSLAAFSALSYLGPRSGLSRAAEIAADLAAIFRTTEDEAFVGGGGESDDVDGNGSAPSAAERKAIEPSESATETATYLLELGKIAAEEAPAEVGTSGGGATDEGDDDVDSKLRLLRGREKKKKPHKPPPLRRGATASLRLLANSYALHVTHLTTGMRVGAAASEALGLLRRKAAGFYQTYPESLSLAPRVPPLLSPPDPPDREDSKRVVDPLRAFRSAVDGAGRAMATEAAAAGATTATTTEAGAAPASTTSTLLLSEVERELVPAVRRAAALFEPLASAE